MTTFTFTPRRLTYLERARAALASGSFRSAAAQKEALGDLNYCYDEAKDAFRKAVGEAAPQLTDWKNPTEAEWKARMDFIYDPANEVPDYLTGLKERHLPTIAKFAGDDVAAAVQNLLALRNEIKACPIVKPETKAEAARKQAAAIIGPNTTNAVAAAVAPLKADAIRRAASDAADLIESVDLHLRANGFDLDKAAPRPAYNESRAATERKNGRRALFNALTTTRARVKLDDPCLADMCPDAAARFIAQAEAEAADQYDAFTVKLASKVGDVETATLQGNHVWGYSILTTTDAAGKVAHWKTQQIVNVSVYGKLFNQWPTRLMK